VCILGDGIINFRACLLCVFFVFCTILLCFDDHPPPLGSGRDEEIRSMNRVSEKIVKITIKVTKEKVIYFIIKDQGQDVSLR